MTTMETAYQAFCKERFPLPSERQVADLEQRLGITLPEDYRQFLLKYNGGFFTEPRIVPTIEGCPLDRLTFLSGIGATHPVAELASGDGLSPTLFDDNDPPQVLPIGYTFMGNLIFLVTHPENRGYVALKKASSDQSFFLAKGIEDFFGLLRQPPDE